MLPWAPVLDTRYLPTCLHLLHYINTWHATHVLALPVPHEAHPFRSQPSKAALVPILPPSQPAQPSPAQPDRLELTDAGAIVGPSSLQTYTQTEVSASGTLCLSPVIYPLSVNRVHLATPSIPPPSPILFPSLRGPGLPAALGCDPACLRGYPSRPLTWPTWAQLPSRRSGSPEGLTASPRSLQVPVSPERCYVCHACPRSSLQAVVYASTSLPAYALCCPYNKSSLQMHASLRKALDILLSTS